MKSGWQSVMKKEPKPTYMRDKTSPSLLTCGHISYLRGEIPLHVNREVILSALTEIAKWSATPLEYLIKEKASVDPA